jgi:hypothetical protein
MIGYPHLLHGTVESGGRSPGMKTLVSHALHVTIRNGPLSLMTQNSCYCFRKQAGAKTPSFVALTAL